MHILIAFASLSGNTRETARLLAAHCRGRGHAVDWLEVEADPDELRPVLDRPHDRYLFGAWTDNAGRTPTEMKRFVALLRDSDRTPSADRIAVFGTGETQWGEEYYCGAAHRLARYFTSPYPVLEIEQMPHGDADRQAIQHWADQVLAEPRKPRSC
jgi:flavodoxin I